MHISTCTYVRELGMSLNWNKKDLTHWLTPLGTLLFGFPTFVDAGCAALEVHDGGELGDAEVPDEGGVVGLDKPGADGLHVVVHRLQFADGLRAQLALGLVLGGREARENLYVL